MRDKPHLYCKNGLWMCRFNTCVNWSFFRLILMDAAIWLVATDRMQGPARWYNVQYEHMSHEQTRDHA